MRNHLELVMGHGANVMERWKPGRTFDFLIIPEVKGEEDCTKKKCYSFNVIHIGQRVTFECPSPPYPFNKTPQKRVSVKNVFVDEGWGGV